MHTLKYVQVLMKLMKYICVLWGQSQETLVHNAEAYKYMSLYWSLYIHQTVYTQKLMPLNMYTLSSEEYFLCSHCLNRIYTYIDTRK